MISFEIDAFCVAEEDCFDPMTKQQIQEEVKNALEGIGIKAEMVVISDDLPRR